MRAAKVNGMTVGQLVERFSAIALDQDKALLQSEYARFNRLFDQMEAVEQELKARPGDQRHGLLRLYEHPSAQVRLKAVKATLALAPAKGRRMLEVIAGSHEYPQAGEAGMSIVNLDRGIFKPT
jgi:Domain of unknown function (DUF2019)